MEIVKLIGADVLPDDQKLVIEIARVIRVGFLQQNAYPQGRHLCPPVEKQLVDDEGYAASLRQGLQGPRAPRSVPLSDNPGDRPVRQGWPRIKYDDPERSSRSCSTPTLTRYRPDLRGTLLRLAGRRNVRPALPLERMKPMIIDYIGVKEINGSLDCPGRCPGRRL